MQQISPRKYFETRLRQLPIYKCVVNENWRDAKIAQVMVLRSHVNGNVSGAIFLVDLLCLGVKDVAWYFNTAPEELVDVRENTSLRLVDIPYELAHNIVYAGLEFAQEYNIKPHADFAIARYALEEDDESIELVEIETGEDGIPHLIEGHPGQYADAHSKLKKHAGPGNFKISLGFESEEEEEDMEDEVDISLNEIELGKLTILDALIITNEDLNNKTLFETRKDHEKLNMNVERAIRAFERMTEGREMVKSVKEEVDSIYQATGEDHAFPLPYPNGCDKDEFEKGMDDFFSILDAIPGLNPEEKPATLLQILKTHDAGNPEMMVHLLFYLLLDKDGPAMYEMIQPSLLQVRHNPMVALAQSFVVTAVPETFTQPPFINSLSPSLKEVLPEFPEFSAYEYCLFYALRCLQATRQQKITQMVTWYRLLAETNEADAYIPMLSTLQVQMLRMIERILMKLEAPKAIPEQNALE